MHSFLKSPLEVACSQLGGGGDSGGSSESPTHHQVSVDDKDLGDITWMPVQGIQDILNSMSPDARDKLLQLMADKLTLVAAMLHFHVDFVSTVNKEVSSDDVAAIEKHLSVVDEYIHAVNSRTLFRGIPG